MGPLAGMGDTIWQGVVIPILLAVCIDLTRSGSGNVWGAVIYAVVIVVAAYALSYWNFMFGYKAGSEAIVDSLEKGILCKSCMWIKDRKFYNNLQHSDKLLRSGLPKYFTISGDIISLLSDEQKTLVFLKNHSTDRSDRYRWWYHRNLSILEITRREAFASLRY